MKYVAMVQCNKAWRLSLNPVNTHPQGHIMAKKSSALSATKTVLRATNSALRAQNAALRNVKRAAAGASQAGRVMRSQGALALAAQKVISARSNMVDPIACGGELMRMVPEKAIAFAGSGMAMMQSAAEMGLRFGPQWLSLMTSRTPLEFWTRSVTHSMAVGAAMMKAQTAMLAPLQDATQRNTLRLGL